MDLNKLVEELGLKDTEIHKYRIRKKEFYRVYIIERYNKENGCLVSLSVSETMLKSLLEGHIKDFASLLEKNFNSAEAKALCKNKA